MKFQLTVDIGDGKRNAPSQTVDVADLDDLLPFVWDSITNNQGKVFGVGMTLKVERLPDEPMQNVAQWLTKLEQEVARHDGACGVQTWMDLDAMCTCGLKEEDENAGRKP